MNQWKVRGKLIEQPYIGQAKAGPYAAGKFEFPDGKYTRRMGFYAPGQAEMFSRAKIGDSFEFVGSLTEKKAGDKFFWQLNVQTATKAGQAAPPASNYNTHITDSDVPF